MCIGFGLVVASIFHNFSLICSLFMHHFSEARFYFLLGLVFHPFQWENLQFKVFAISKQIKNMCQNYFIFAPFLPHLDIIFRIAFGIDFVLMFRTLFLDFW